MVLSLHPVSPLSVYVHGHRRACVCEFADILNLFMGIMKGDWMCICYLTCIKIGFWRIFLLCWFVSVWKNGWINSLKLISICCFIVSIYRKFVSKWLMHDWNWNWLWMCLKIHVVYDSDLPASFSSIFLLVFHMKKMRLESWFSWNLQISLFCWWLLLVLDLWKGNECVLFYLFLYLPWNWIFSGLFVLFGHMVLQRIEESNLENLKLMLLWLFYWFDL